MALHTVGQAYRRRRDDRAAKSGRVTDTLLAGLIVAACFAAYAYAFLTG